MTTALDRHTGMTAALLVERLYLRGMPYKSAFARVSNRFLGAGAESGTGTPNTPSVTADNHPAASSCAQAASGPAPADLKSIPAENRRESLRTITPSLSTRRAETLQVVRSFPNGATAEEVADVLGKPTYWIRPRISELLAVGKINVIGKRCSAITGKNISVFRAV